jgi:alkylation response protein AidB-like acyl-CoA dehydrogenase
MDFSLEYTKEQEEFAKEVQAWIGENVPKDLVRSRDSITLSYEQWQKRRELGRKLGEKGWLYPGHPREYGGGGLDADHSFVLYKEIAEAYLGLPPYYSNTLGVPAILRGGSEEQKTRFLPPVFKGGGISWQLFTEPEAGTDEANQQTNALRPVRDKDHFIVNGQKIFVGCTHYSLEELQLWLLTRSDPDGPRHRNLATFFIPATLPGITIRPLDLFPPSTFSGVSGRAPLSSPGVKNVVFFDDVRIHESYLIGGETEGWRMANLTLEVEHGGGGGEGAGREVEGSFIAERFLAQCKSNPNIVKRLEENPQLLDRLANIYVGAQIERLFSMRNAWLRLSGGRVAYAGPQRILYAKMFGTRFVADMAEVLGPYSLTDDAEWGLDEDIFEVGQRCGVCMAPGGTPEALKIAISRALAIGR